MQDQSPEAILRHIKDLGKSDSNSIHGSKTALVAIGASAVPYLLDALTGSASETARWRASEVLGRIGKDAVPGLIGLAQHHNPLVRRMVIDALGATRDARALPVIQAAAQDSNEKVRATSRSALKEFGVQEVTQPSSSPAAAPYTPTAASTMSPAGPPPASLVRLSPNRFVDSFRVIAWYFFAADRLKAFKEYEGDLPVQQLASLPISTMVWIPLAIPVVAFVLGVVTLYRGWFTNLLLILAVPVGWLLTWLLSRAGLQGQPGFLKSLGLLLLVGVGGFVVFSEIRFVAITFAELGLRTGSIIVATFVLAMSVAIGVGLDLGLNLPMMFPAIAGGIIGFFIPGELNIEYVPYVFWGMCIFGGVIVSALPAILVQQALKRYQGTFGRLVALAAGSFLNLGLIWLMLFDGWYTLHQMLR